MEGFCHDYEAMESADAFCHGVKCVLPAHLEAGWAIGAGKPTCLLPEDRQEPELMYKLADCIPLDVEDVLNWLTNLS